MNSLREEAVRTANTIVGFFRSKNLKIPPSQVVEFVHMLETLYCLKGRVDVKDIVDLAESVFTLINWDNSLRMELVNILEGREHKASRNIYNLISGRLASRLRFGHVVQRREIFSRKVTANDLLEYIALRKTGVLRRTRSGQLRAVDINEYNRIIKRYKGSRETLEPSDILKYIDEIPSKYWHMIISDEVIKSASISDLMKLGRHALTRRDLELGRKVLVKISEYLQYGAKLHNKDKKIVKSLIEKTGYSDLRLVIETLHKDRFTDLDERGVEKLLSEIMSLPLSERQRILSKIARIVDDSLLERMVEKLDIITLSSLKSVGNKRLKNIALLGESIKLLVRAHILNDQSFIDYSIYTAKKIDPEDIDPKYRPVMESILVGNISDVFKKLPSKDKYGLLELILNMARDATLSYSDQESLLRALKLGYKIMRSIILRHGSVYQRKEKDLVGGHRVDVRGSLYNYVRLNYRPVFVRKVKGSEIIALLDVSGSMLPYNLWAVSCLAVISSRVRSLVIFSDKINIVNTRFRSRKLFIDFMKTLLLTEFRGYTDIAGALRESLKLSNRDSVVVLISDLKQTVPGNPLEEASRILGRGIRLLVITPPNHDYMLAEKLRSLGADVIVAKSPYDIPYILKRKLSLKAGVIKEFRRL